MCTHNICKYCGNYSVNYGKFLCVFLDITINFNDSVYSTKEDNGLIQPRLIFSNPSSFDIAIQVDSVDINATAG